MSLTPTASPPASSDPSEHIRDNAKLRQILDGARQVFLADGFDGASMNDIARAAGVSKGTLYVYFESKEALFEALVRNQKQEQAERHTFFDDPDSAVADNLQRVGRSMCEMLMKPDSVAIVRMVIGVAGKFPQIGRAFYEAGPQFGKERFAAYLEGQAAAGKLRIDDPAQAASNFLQLAHSEIIKARLFGMMDDISQELIERSVDNAVDVFMRAYGPAR